ncbi:MAG: hypothetical protein FJ386_00250 [Verrucomicrobia bacterium]|nr:hypothetical protein [Verrucomicrobiota bacterium]
MKKLLASSSALALFLGFALSTPPDALAQKKKGEKGEGGLNGAITAVNKADKTFSIAGKTVGVDSTTIITRDGNPATFDTLKNGEQAAVSTFTQADKLLAVSIKIGKVAATIPPPVKKKK